MSQDGMSGQRGLLGSGVLMCLLFFLLILCVNVLNEAVEGDGTKRKQTHSDRVRGKLRSPVQVDLLYKQCPCLVYMNSLGQLRSNEASILAPYSLVPRPYSHLLFLGAL